MRQDIEEPKIVYYTDPLHDDFADSFIRGSTPPKGFSYLHKNLFYRFFAFVLYRLILTPIIYLFLKPFYRIRIIGKEKIKKGKEGYYVYANHTAKLTDAIHPTMVSFPKKSYILVNPDATSFPVLRTVVQMLGGMPLYDDFRLKKECIRAIHQRVEEGNCIFIYPEAHIWPYCTWIRPFPDLSFRYPAKTNSPVFACTTVFTKRKFLFTKIPKYTYYIDGPFYSDEALSVKERQKCLREQVYAAMVERSKLSTYEKVKYVSAEENRESVQ